MSRLERVQARDQLAPSCFLVSRQSSLSYVLKGTGTVGEDDDFAVALFRRHKDAREQSKVGGG
jgi:hypothetical protein